MTKKIIKNDKNRESTARRDWRKQGDERGRRGRGVISHGREGGGKRRWRRRDKGLSLGRGRRG